MKRIVTLLASLALVASGLHILPAAAAEEPPAVPEVVNIEDPYGDANTQSGDQMLPADGSTVSDLGKVWFSHNDTDFNVHILTEGPPGANTVGIQFEVIAGEGGCAIFSGIYKGLTYLSDNYGRLVDSCNGLDPIIGTFTFGEGPDGAGLATITVPRSGSPLLSDGSSVTAPLAKSWIFAGGEQLTPSGYRGVRQMVDDTKAGTDYAIAAATPSGKTPPGKNPVPGKKKGCDNGKGKKRGCEGKGPKKPKPGKPAAKCAPFAPGDAGKDKPTVVLTDAATEAAPVEQKINLDASVGDADVVGAGHELGGLPAPAGPSLDYFNIQVDARAEDAGLYVLFEFPSRRDYDLNLYHPDGSYAARSHGMNTMIPEGRPTGFTNEAGHGGVSTDTSESLVGIRTAPCGGWTLETANWLGEGGEMVVKLWLGEVQNDALAEGEQVP